MRNNQRPQVLMVDDDQDFCGLLMGWLAPRYDCVILSQTDELFEELAAMEPDLLILDVNMPGPSGIALCRRIRAQMRYVSLPILFLTGRKDDETFLLSMDVGGTAYMTKPVERRRFLGVVRELTMGAKAA